jgi:CBS domain-containing protein
MLDQHISPAGTIEAAAYTTTTNGADVDLANFDAATFVFDIGIVTADDLVLTLEEAPDDGTGSPGAYTVVDAADLDGVVPLPTTVLDQLQAQVGYLGNQRFVRAVVTDSGTGDGILSVVVIRGKGRKPA